MIELIKTIKEVLSSNKNKGFTESDDYTFAYIYYSKNCI